MADATSGVSEICGYFVAGKTTPCTADPDQVPGVLGAQRQPGRALQQRASEEITE